MEISLTCEKCGNEIILELEYGEINYDPRDGYRDYGYTGGVVDKEYRECKCDFSSIEEDHLFDRAIEKADYSDEEP